MANFDTNANGSSIFSYCADGKELCKDRSMTISTGLFGFADNIEEGDINRFQSKFF